MKLQKIFLITGLLAIFLLGMGINVARADMYDDVMNNKELIMGSDTTYPPFEFQAENQSYVGFDVDLARAIADEMGVTLKVKSVAWESIIPSLKAGDFHILVSAMTITEDRAKEIDFTCAYYNSSQAILVKKGNPKNINSVEDLNDSSIIIGVQTGTTSDIFATDHLTQAADIKRYEQFTLALQALDAGEVDAVLGDLPVVAYASQTGQVNGEVVGTFGTPEYFGIGIKKGETRLYNAVTDALKELFSNGKYAQIYKKWFGINPDLDSCYPVIEPSGESSTPGFEFVSVTFVLLPFAVATLLYRKKSKK